MPVFSEVDRYCRRVRVDAEGARHVLNGPLREGFEPDSEEELEFGYRAAGWVIRDRLEAMGFTLDA